MRVCAEFEEHVGALEAHRHLVDSGVDPHDIEIRSPYPLPEEPIPPHYSTPMYIRTVARIMWACAVIFGFSFVSYTQYVWAPVTVTDGHPLIPPPITMIVTYECGMFTAIWTTTFMFFLETFRYRSLVPPLEEDLPVGIGYVVLVIRNKSADLALRLLDGRGARSIVTYSLMFLLMGMSLTGCARNNMREQDVYKSTAVASNFPPANSLRMPSAEELAVPAPAPLNDATRGDVARYDQVLALKAAKVRLNWDKQPGNTTDGNTKRIDDEYNDADKSSTLLENQLAAEHRIPELYVVKKRNAVPKEMDSWTNPVKPDAASLARGEVLFNSNCSGCHGVDGLGDGKVGEVEYVRPASIGNGKDGVTATVDNATVPLQNYTTVKDSYFYYYIFTGKNLMPMFGYRLTPREICDIINHLHHLQGKV
jgi:mono/diheme cytochrome c family protein